MRPPKGELPLEGFGLDVIGALASIERYH